MQILAGQGVLVDRQTLGRWMKRLAWWLKGLYELQLRVMHANPRLFCDETPISCPRARARPLEDLSVWAHAVDDRPWNGPAAPAVAYIFAPSAARRKSPHNSPISPASCKSTHMRPTRRSRKIAAFQARSELAFCLAHARRKFVAVFKTTQLPVAKRGDRANCGSYMGSRQKSEVWKPSQAALPQLEDWQPCL